MFCRLSRRSILSFLIVSAVSIASLQAEEPAEKESGAGAKISYYNQIRSIFQANCQGCHQPAKAQGDYDMMSFDKMLAGGESETPAIVAGKVDESYLIEMITPDDGEAEMPKGKQPLGAFDIELIKTWIAQGAIDDTPESAKVSYDMNNPPSYTLPPVITSMDYSPDGKLLAVAGFHEVLLHKADGSGLEARLVGMSQRIESVKFSPDGKQLAVTGGLPARMGEVQVWNVEKRELTLSHSVTYDTIYGASWSPDGKLIAFGCADNTVRAIEAETGKAVLYQGSHSDWVLDTVFTKDGGHVISVSRDRTTKLTEKATQRFIDNITSITPGALKGGIGAVVRHPSEDVIVVGGADGAPKLYHVFRQSKRVIGDDANLIRKFPALTGRVFDLAISSDGGRIAAVSSLDGAGELKIYSIEYEAETPKDILAIAMKRVAQRSVEEKKKITEYHNKGVTVAAEIKIDKSGLYAVAISPDGKIAAMGGSDGLVRLVDAETGSITKEFSPVPLNSMQAKAKTAVKKSARRDEVLDTETLHKDDVIVSLEVQPEKAAITNRFDNVQILATARLASGDTIDVTRMAKAQVAGAAAEISPRGRVRAMADGQTKITFSIAGKTAVADIETSGIGGEYHADYYRDVNPVISKVGCNGGTCHGANKGKGGLKLSLRGNDAIFDLRAFTDDLASRRVNNASAENSLMLLKAAAAVPHLGGQLTKPGEPYYEILRSWIADGAKLDLQSPRVAKIDITPKNPVAQRVDSKQQFRIVATYSDGSTRDVTAETTIQAAVIDVGEADNLGLVTALRRGETPIIARFEGAYAVTTLTVMGDRTGFVWKAPPANNFIDELVAGKLERTQTAPSPLCTDAEFIRRIYLDLTGLPPSAEEVRNFLADSRETRVKRDALIGRLVGNDDFVEHWTNKWAEMLQVNRKYLGLEGSQAFRKWVRDQVAANTPYDQFALQILTASGSNKENPPASYYKIHRTPEDTMENTTHLFLGVRFSCNKCHDHPFEKWKQDQYYETAAYFAQVGLKKDPASGKKQIGATAVEKGKPLYEIVFDKKEGEVTHVRSGSISPPKFPYATQYEVGENATRREHIANWITSSNNQYFAKSYVNRMWSYLLGAGFIEPVDDIRAGNPPTNPELLNRLTEEFLENNFDIQHLIRIICKSRTYQLSVASNKWNEDDTINYSHAMARRLPAEVLFDSMHRVTGSISKIPGIPEGARAAQLPDSGAKLDSGFLAQFGRPVRESPCECERSSGMQFGPVMSLVSGTTVSNLIADPNSEIAKLVETEKDDAKLIGELFLRILNRPATEAEVKAGKDFLSSIPSEHKDLVAQKDAFEKTLAPSIAEKEKVRQAAIAAAKNELEAYKKEIAPREAELDLQHKDKIAKLEIALKEYEQKLPEQLTAWEASDDKETKWIPLDPAELSSTSATTLTKQEDLSITAKNSNGLGAYKIVVHTDLQDITAVRLEALIDKASPKNGPGRAPDGNFVLSEFELSAASKSDPAKKAKVALHKAQADFSQKGYDVATAIDGKAPRAGNGWAIAPQPGKDHMACFETKQPIRYEGGITLTFLLKQEFNSGKHSLGRFRLSATTSKGSIMLNGLPQDITKVLAVAADQRDDEQKSKLMAHFRGVDDQLKKLQADLAQSKKPRPIDPKLTQLQGKFDTASQPLPVDPKLARLRRDVETSKKQLEVQRLTGAQDITWALLNSPAFLFNR